MVSVRKVHSQRPEVQAGAAGGQQRQQRRGRQRRRRQTPALLGGSPAGAGTPEGSVEAVTAHLKAVVASRLQGHCRCRALWHLNAHALSSADLQSVSNSTEGGGPLAA